MAYYDITENITQQSCKLLYITMTSLWARRRLNHHPHHCLLTRLFGSRSKKISKLRVTGLCAGNSPLTGEFPAQMASNAENVYIWWRHNGNGYAIDCQLDELPICMIYLSMWSLRATWYCDFVRPPGSACQRGFRSVASNPYHNDIFLKYGWRFLWM